MERTNEIRARLEAATPGITDDERAEIARIKQEICDCTNPFYPATTPSAEIDRMNAGHNFQARSFRRITMLISVAERLTADLAAMTAERDALNHCLKYERGAKAAFEIRWRVENAKYNKSVVHLQRARGQRDTLNVELERMQKEVDKLPTYESANSGLHDKLCAAAAERDAFKARAEAAERDILLALKCSSDPELCGLCGQNGCGDSRTCAPKWRGPDAGGEGLHG